MSTKTEPQPKPKSLGRRILGGITEGIVILVIAAIIAALIRTFVAQMFIIPSGSMENTLLVGDRVVVSKFSNYERGDVVVFKDPGNWLNIQSEEPGAIRRGLEFIGVLPDSSTEHLIKRVIGMPGDHVRLDPEGRIEINGQAIDETAYLYTEGGTQVAPATVPFDVVVPEDRIFVLGDHRNASGDSRCHLSDVVQGEAPGAAAFIPMDDVVGRAVAIVAPLDRLSVFYTPEAFADVPEATEAAPASPILNHIEPGC